MNIKHHYDLNRAPIVNVSRRDFLKGVGAGALVLSIGLPKIALAEDAPKYAGEGMPHGLRDDVKLFVAIGPDGVVTLTNIRAEMGQGIRTGMAIVVADELEADWSKMKVVQAVGSEERYGNRDTDGSRSTRQHFVVWRRIGAAARMMLEQAAAAQWNVPVSEVYAANHEVIHKPSGKKLSYGALAKAASAQPAPANDTIKLKDPSKFRYIGTGKVPLIDNMELTTGKAVYGQDTRMDGMVYAVVERSPVHFGKVVSYDATETLKVPGVLKVIPIDPTPPPALFLPKGGIAVIATNTWAAMQGREKLQVKWDDGEHSVYSSGSYKAELQDAVRKPGLVVRTHGDAESALKGAAKRMEGEYYFPLISHTPMEPPAALAKVADGKAEIWACVQGPEAAVGFVAARLGMKPEDITVHQTFLGGGFGRKSQVDFVVEAAYLSKAMDGTPVKVVFGREDDIQADYYHTVSAERIEAGLDGSGKVVAWRHRSAAPSLFALFMPDPKHQSFIEKGMGLVDMPLDIPNIQVENPEAVAHTRIGWFRSVSNLPHAFAVQSFITEMAVAQGRDPKEFMLELLGPNRKMHNLKDFNDTWNYGEDPARYPYDTARLRGVIELVAKQANWGRKLPKGQGLGIAAHRSFASYTAAVVHAVVENGKLTIPRVDIAVDCGPQVNPDRVRAQMEGSVVMGVAIATLGEITFVDGKVQQKNFDSYKVTRMDGAPREIHVHSVKAASYDQPLGGVGEPGLPPVPPALVNAIFAATGKRIRELPIQGQLKV
jgi:isoquinoline 1-oxidoreductase beta subunit